MTAEQINLVVSKNLQQRVAVVPAVFDSSTGRK